jgi:hypothetical protein
VDDLVQDTVEIRYDSLIAEPQNPNSSFLEIKLLVQVRCFTKVPAMPGAIELNRKFGVRTEEINDAISNWLLSSKLKIRYLSVAES